MSNILNDLRYAIRQLRRAPFFSITVLLTLALATGATAAVTGVLRATLLNPLPYAHVDRLVTIADHNRKGLESNGLTSIARTAELRALEHDGHRVFSSLGFYYYNDSKVTLDGHEPVPVSAGAVSGDFFSTVASPAALGRTITPDDEQRNAPLVLVLSDRTWRSVFAADPHILGRTLRLGSELATIVGVMPPQFNLPQDVDLWYSGRLSVENFHGYRGDGSRFVLPIARLAPGETLASAAAAAALLSTQLANAYPGTDAAWDFTLTTLRDSLFGSIRQALVLVSCAVGLILIVTAVNFAGLQLARNATRRPEFAVRRALGVSSPRLIRQLLTENLLLVFLGTALGMVLGAALLRVCVAQLPAEVLVAATPHIDPFVIAVVSLLALTIGVLTGLVPALHSTQAPLALTETRMVAPAARRFGKAFAAAQITLALILLTLSAGVLERLYRLLHTPLAFEPNQIATFAVDLPWNSDPVSRHHFYQQAQASLEALPGVVSAGSITALPLSTFSLINHFDIAGQTSTPQHDAVVAEARSFTTGYLRTLHIPLLAGRDFKDRDADPNARPVLIINDTLARRYFAGKDPIGQHLLWKAGADEKSLVSSEIVGVIGSVQGSGGSLTGDLKPEVYRAGDNGWPHMQFALRTSLPAATLEPEIRRLIAGMNATASVGHVTHLSSAVEGSLAQPRLNAGLLTSFAVFSLLLVMLGIYGLMAFEVTQRTRELGLRLALGSTRGGILALLLGEASQILIAGLALGTLASLATTRLLAATLSGMHSHSGLLVVLGAPLLTFAVLGATLIPAGRAAAGDPMQALRTE